MYVWEMVAYRLRMDGWEVWHTTRPDPHGPSYLVHLHRPGITCEVSGPTLTEAYAAASRRAREQWAGSRSLPAGPHFGRGLGSARVASGF
jgi:hypothetical protein